MTFDITDIVKRAQKAKKIDSIPLGRYACRCDKVEWAPNFEIGSAFKMHYVLTSPKGEEYVHEELFYNSETERSIKFFNYLFDAGISNVFDFEGMEEEIVIGYNVRGSHRYTSIISRKFVSKESETA